MFRRASIAWVLISLPAVWLLLFLIVPLILMAVFSLRPDLRGGMFSTHWTPTLEHYQSVFESEDYLRLLGISVQVAFIVALVGALLAYPLAYFLAFHAPKRRSLLLILLLLP